MGNFFIVFIFVSIYLRVCARDIYERERTESTSVVFFCRVFRILYHVLTLFLSGHIDAIFVRV